MKQDVQNQSVKKGNPYMGFLGVILIVLILNGLVFPKLTGQQIISTDYGTFIEKVDSGIVKEVMIKSNQIFFTAQENGGKTKTFQTGEVNDPQLVDRLLKADSPNPDGKIAFNQIIPEENSPILNFLLMWILPGLIFYIIWHQTRKTIQSRMGAGGNFMSFGDSGAKIYADADIKTTFADVAGQEEAKDTLKEIVDFLHNPKKYTEIGASLPKGALLVGPPGTGKTLIARAVAGEAKVPFFAISGSEFVQMFVGMGAAKVRDLFKQATEKAPCIIFIDEIDKIAGRYGASGGPDVSREGVQRDILPIVEGATVKTKYGRIKTDHILFMAAGAFHVSKPSDLIPELQGRFPIRVELKSLTEEDLRKILTEPRQALIRQYTALLETEGVTVTFTEDSVSAIAEIASVVNSETEDIGARRLYTILERVLEELSFEASELENKEVTIDGAYVRQKLGEITKDMDTSNYIL